MTSKDGATHDPLRQLADSLRSKDGLEVRSGVLEGHRVEFFRGKDFVRFLKTKPEKFAKFGGGPGRSEEEQAKTVLELMLRRGLLARCDRMYKKPQPGSKKMVKFPKKLVHASPSDPKNVVEESFYAYTYERPTSPWLYLWASLGTAGVLLACLFPLAPAPIKIAVFYLCAALVALILAVIALRSVVAAVTWIASGSTLWILPNLLSEELPITELFKPLVSVQPPSKESTWGNHPLARLGFGAVLAGLFWLLYAHSPDKATVARTVLHSRDELFDFLKINPDAKLLANTSHNASATVNATMGDHGAAGPAPAAAAEAAAAGGSGGSSHSVGAEPEAASEAAGQPAGAADASAGWQGGEHGEEEEEQEAGPAEQAEEGED